MGRNGTNFGQTFSSRGCVNSSGEIYVSECGVTERVTLFTAEAANVLRPSVGRATRPDSSIDPKGWA